MIAAMPMLLSKWRMMFLLASYANVNMADPTRQLSTLPPKTLFHISLGLRFPLLEPSAS
jgi:hypothetical protein